MEEIDTRELAADELRALTSPEFVDVRIDFGIARAEVAAQAAARQTAELWHSVAEVLDEAERFPEVFLHPGARLSESERREYAVRSAAADLAVRLAVAETTVRTWGSHAQLLRGRAPRVWSAFRDGGISVANARTIAEFVGELPHEVCAEFDQAVPEAAGRLAPARFRAVARAARERVQTQQLAERHRRAALDRRVALDIGVDGMAWLSIHLPSATARRAFAGIDAAARSLQTADETRTLDQLRADVAGELLTGAASGAPVGVSVAVTVPVMTLLGASDEPGLMEGVGPIDARTARLLAADAPSFVRLLTHPVTGAVLELDRTTYRVPADLRRALRHRDRTCRFAGCGRLAERCDVDHVREWQHGGATDAANLLHLCRHHHRLKSVARWKVESDAGTTTVTWTSPTGSVTAADPPPF